MKIYIWIKESFTNSNFAWMDYVLHSWSSNTCSFLLFVSSFFFLTWCWRSITFAQACNCPYQTQYFQLTYVAADCGFRKNFKVVLKSNNINKSLVRQATQKSMQIFTSYQKLNQIVSNFSNKFSIFFSFFVLICLNFKKKKSVCEKEKNL